MVVLVATARALKMHGGVNKKELDAPDPEAVRRGAENLVKHIENIGKFGVPALVAINAFPGDTPEEHEAIADICTDAGAAFALSEHFAKGGEGAADLAKKAMEILNAGGGKGAPLYNWKSSVEEKIETVARQIYGAEAVDFTTAAKRDIKAIVAGGYDGLPVCIAKTQSSLSDNPQLLGRPKDFLVTVRRIVINAGAGFLVPLTGDIMRMPGLPRVPSALNIDIDDDGVISGLS
jgi:formate--tetrahydrofolate ligase